MSLSKILPERTAALHRRAERSGYVQEILRGRADKSGYALYLRSLLPAYRSMEEALDHQAAHPVLAAFEWRSLARASRIEADLAVLAGSGWRDRLPLVTEAVAYGDHIREIGDKTPLRLIGQAYVRYIGDLSGGLIVRSILERAPGLPAEALNFHDFPAIPDPAAFKQQFRDQLDRLSPSQASVEPIVEEAILAFEFNIELSLAVQAALPAQPRSEQPGDH